MNSNNMLLKPAKTINTSSNTSLNNTSSSMKQSQPQQQAKNNLELKRNNLNVLASNNANASNTSNSGNTANNSENTNKNLNAAAIDAAESDDGLVNTDQPKLTNNVKVINI
jgi:hypothetical protein